MEENKLAQITKITNDIEFENDFGQEPLGLGRITKDQGVISVCSLAAAFVGSAIAGIPLALVVLAVGLNDIGAVNRSRRANPKPVKEEEPGAIDVPAREVEPPGLPITEQDVQPADSTSLANSERDRLQQVPIGASSPAQPVQSVPATRPPKNKEELLKALRQQCPALLSLVKSHPIRCVGVQRSGKTTWAKKLVLLRLVLLPGHRAIASTPHYEPTNSYPDAFQIVGISNGKRDYPSIRKEWNGLAQRVEDGQVNSITTIWDEFGLMNKVVEEEVLTAVLTSCLRETFKFGEYPVFIVHGETQAFLPGSKGLVTVFLEGTVRVETVGEKTIGDDGLETIQPTGKFKIQWLDGTKEEGKIPDWLTEELLMGMLPQSMLTTIQTPVTSPAVVTEETPELEAVVPTEATTELKLSDSLKEPLKSIWLFAKEKDDWITVRDIQRKTFSVLRGKGSKEIHQYFGLLADMGYGQIDEEGKSDSSVGFLSN
ncbi:hypothetical protein H6F50_21260 [Coleofasciculus sp. FACHB-712]|uniref:hypothetical protein n=1 Tax=Coleofasciculus sp. FACHB-712 TaxID=2692789 RepID=UPI001689C716|nr:hypothetical protein [Coleofasciculus sp. FACHB-712]MBD1944855.1 hypothetical protein [Coleofasciculus sp. FACHB-712]